MRRHGPTLLVLALLVATGISFVVAERVKLETSPIRGPRVDPVFSPVCECADRVARISFRLSRADTLGVSLVDARGRLVRVLVADHPYLAIHRLEFDWDGRDDRRRIVPEGIYRPRVHFADRDRTIVLPNPIRVDETPPTIHVLGVRPRRFSPDGDGRLDGIAVRYRVDEPARALLLVDGVQRVRGRLRTTLDGQVQWYGRAGGKTFPAGSYRLALVAIDEAGNLSRPVAAGTVRIRYIEASPARVSVRLGARFRVRVATDASYAWSFAGRSGVARTPALVLRARRAGRLELVVSEHGHRAGVVVVVSRSRRRARRPR